MNPLQPTASLLCKLGSVAVHVQEFLSPGGHSFDKDAALSALSDPEVQQWLKAMDDLAFLPKMRTAEDLRISMERAVSEKYGAKPDGQEKKNAEKAGKKPSRKKKTA